ncbi:hypothetical protein D8911_04040 [Levilactobacillus brevis]|nr:hypothetical protein D8911_04040 [Levilactobacillus brevis]
MVPIYWEGLTTAQQEQAATDNLIDLTKLRPSDVARVAYDHPLDVDWSSVIFIKNFRTVNQQVDTVVWTANEGFYRTSATPNALLAELSAISGVSGFDQKTDLGYLRLSGPVPFVVGSTMLVSTERPMRANNVSWLGGQEVANVKSGAHLGNVRVILNNGAIAIFKDSPTRLRKKLDEACQLRDFEQQRWALAQEQRNLVYGRSYDQDLRDYPAYRDHQLLWAAFRKAGYPVGLADVDQILREVYACDPRSWHLTDER